LANGANVVTLAFHCHQRGFANAVCVDLAPSLHLLAARQVVGLKDFFHVL
jgi:hypothetical protein